MSAPHPGPASPAGLDACCTHDGHAAGGTACATHPAPVARARLPREVLAFTIAAAVLTGTGLFLDGLPARLCFAAAMAAGGRLVLPSALRSLRRRSLDMNVLMVTAAAGAAVIGEWAEGAAVLTLFAIAELLERGAMARARNAIAALMETAPHEARVRRNGSESIVPVEAVALGELIRVRPGERIPLDGVVTEGSSSVNEAPITGEAMPAEKTAGAEVYAGSLNGHGALEIRTTARPGDTLLAQIGDAVQHAQASRAPVQSFVDRFAKRYTPAVVVLAVLVAVVPPLAGMGELTTWLYRALALLVIACPCALVISTPVTVVSGLTGAARDGVLVRGGAELERLASVDSVAFDKTGTLTEGRPVLTDLAPVGGGDAQRLLRLAAGVEQDSEHPLAQAIVDAARDRALEVPAATAFAALPGKGARATVDGESLYVGSRRICGELGTCHDDVHAALDRFEGEGKTAVLLTSESESKGVLAVADRIRPEAAGCLEALRRLGVRKTILLTGDNRAAAERVAGELGLSEWRAGLLPEDKLAAVRELTAAGWRLAVVGDGVNDAPALAAAHAGIAMGAAGTHVALETADVALMADDLAKLPVAIRRARRTLSLVRQNVAFAIGIKLVFLTLAILGQATLWMAVAADTGASLAVIANGLRALRSPGGAAA
ncbi:MAG TPA: heavy metal translocating P-type ATPase [Gemmatimonadales bacterium]|nr:heavy metal translocating P-type ATPase [Gemmatimonadales bacterium]